MIAVKRHHKATFGGEVNDSSFVLKITQTDDFISLFQKKKKKIKSISYFLFMKHYGSNHKSVKQKQNQMKYLPQNLKNLCHAQFLSIF